MSIFPEEQMQRVRGAIDPVRILRAIGYYAESTYPEGAILRAFCPIHREAGQYTLHVDVRNATYRCSKSDCPGSNGGDLIDLYAKSRRIDYDEALLEVAEIFHVRLDPAHLNRSIQQDLDGADRLYREGSHSEAEVQYLRILKLRPQSAQALRGLADVYKATGREKDAASLPPRLAEALGSEGDWAGAFEVFKIACEADPANDDLRARLIEAVCEGRLAGDPLQYCRRRIQEMVEAGVEEPALRLLETLQGSFAEDPALMELKAEAHAKLGNKVAARETLIGCLDLMEKHGEHEKALNLVDKALAEDSDDIALLSRRAGTLRRLERIDEAVRCYLAMIEFFESGGQNDRAAAVYQSVIELEPDRVQHRQRQFDLYVEVGMEPIIVTKALALAKAYRREGRGEDAARALEHAMTLAPKNADLLALHAETLEDRGRADEAADRFLAAAKLFIQQMHYERAKQYLEKILAHRPDNREARELRAEVLIDLDQPAQAADQWETLAVERLSSGDAESAAALGEKILRLDPDRPETLRLMIDAYGRLDRSEDRRSIQMKLIELRRNEQSWEQVRDLCQALLSETENYAPAIEALADWAERSQRTEILMANLWKLAEIHQREGEKDKEQSALDRILKHEPLHPEAWKRNLSLLAERAAPRMLADAVAMATELFVRALRARTIEEILEQLCAGSEARPEFLGALARLRADRGNSAKEIEALRAQADRLAEDGRHEEAIELLGRLVIRLPEDLSIHQTRIELMERCGLNERAAAEYRRVAEIHLKAQRTDEAIAACRKAIGLDPADRSAHDLLITLYLRQGRRELADKTIEEQAASYLSRGEYALAAAAYARSLEIDPDREDTHRKIIAVQKRAGDVADALNTSIALLDLLESGGRSSEFEQAALEAIALDPSNWMTRRRLADHLTRVGRLAEAEEALIDLARLQIKSDALDAARSTLDEALEINPESVRARALRAEILARRGDGESALSEFLIVSSTLGSLRAAAPEPVSAFAYGNYEGLKRVKRDTFERFVVGTRNHFAQAAARAVCQEPGSNYNPLFIHADVGLGKTHLCHAICNDILDRRPELKVMFTTIEDFTGALTDAVRRHGVTEFRNRHRMADALIIDDIQFLSGRERAQEEFFHIFNALYEDGKQIVITSDRPPKHLSHLEKRLRSRFGAGVIVDIQPPELETRMTILRKELARRGKQDDANDEALLHLAEAIPDNIRDLKGALNQLLARAEISGEPITLELARRAVDQVTARA